MKALMLVDKAKDVCLNRSEGCDLCLLYGHSYFMGKDVKCVHVYISYDFIHIFDDKP